MTDIKARNIQWHEGYVGRADRWAFLKCCGGTVWFTGLSASGKSTIASAVEQVLVQRGVHAYRLDGDNVRHGLNKNLGFSRKDREENIRRIGEVAKLFADSGCIALTAFISPYIADRDLVRRLHEQDGLAFLEVFVDAPLEVCEQRDPKGHYARARRGLIKGFTGLDDPYERPPSPDLVVETASSDVDACVRAVVRMVEDHGLISGPDGVWERRVLEGPVP